MPRARIIGHRVRCASGISTSTLERRYATIVSYSESNEYRNKIFHQRADLGRSLDYLETRADIDEESFSYFAVSSGAVIAPIMLAVERHPERSARPFFELLGTAEADKRLLFAPTSHTFPTPDVTRETLDWLDRHLGEVR